MQERESFMKKCRLRLLKCKMEYQRWKQYEDLESVV